jgi:hypothetical protein
MITKAVEVYRTPKAPPILISKLNLISLKAELQTITNHCANELRKGMD